MNEISIKEISGSVDGKSQYKGMLCMEPCV